jgi:hypothetical protein
MEEESSYAAAGFISKGVLEDIRREMTSRFPSASTPILDHSYRRYRGTSGVVAYSYLSVDADFRHSFYARDDPLVFTASDRDQNPVVSFCAEPQEYEWAMSPEQRNVREQVEILYYDYDNAAETAEFAVDLCKHTRRYQVVLACVLHRRTLSRILTDIRTNIAEFKDGPDYEVLRKLQPIEKLVVPDVLYKIMHQFQELCGRAFGNATLAGVPICEARQMTDFSLSRMGVIVRSKTEIFSVPVGFPPHRTKEARLLYFNRPFLIYVRKREANAQPFFVMWVDNAELMQPYHPPARADSSRP